MFWFGFTSEELRQVNREVFACCPCRKCPCTFNIFSQKPAMIISGFVFFPEYIYQLKAACLLSLQLLSCLWLLRHRKDVLQWSKFRFNINLFCQQFSCLLCRYFCQIFHVWNGKVLSLLLRKNKFHIFDFSLKRQRGLVENVFPKVQMANSLKILLWQQDAGISVHTSLTQKKTWPA